MRPDARVPAQGWERHIFGADLRRHFHVTAFVAKGLGQFAHFRESVIRVAKFTIGVPLHQVAEIGLLLRFIGSGAVTVDGLGHALSVVPGDLEPRD